MNERKPEARAFRHIRMAVGVLRWLLLALAVALVALVIRIYAAPLSLDFMKPVLQDALVIGDETIRVDFDRAALVWERSTDPLDGDWSFLTLNLTELTLHERGGRVLIAVPEGRVRLSGTAMLAGRLAPAALEVKRLRLAVQWHGQDLIATLGRLGTEDAGPGSPAAQVLGLLAPSDREQAAGYLQRISVRDAEVLVAESLTDSRWSMTNADLRFSRGADSMLLDGTGTLSRDGEALTRVDVAGIYSPATAATHLQVLFEDFNPSALAGHSQALEPLRMIDMPLTGSFGVALGQDRDLRQVSFDLAAGSGMVTVPNFYDGGVRLDGGAVRGRYDVVRGQTEIDELRVEFVGAVITGDGLVYKGENDDDPLGLRFHATVRDLPFQWLKDYWPEGFGGGARDWVARNLTAGHATTGDLKLHLTPDRQARGVLPEDAFDFTFAFRDTTAHYLRPMPPIVDGHGDARLTAHAFELRADGGRTGAVEIGPSRLRFDGIHRPGQTVADINVLLMAPIPDVLELIDHDPLGYPSAYGLDPRSIEGDATASLRLDFPLVRALTLADVDFKVQAVVDPVRLPSLFGDVAVTNGTVTLRVDRDGIRGDGRLALNGLPFGFVWREAFAAGDGLSTEFRLNGALSGNDWEILSLPLANHVDGPGDVNLVLRGRGADIREGSGRFDFGGASFGFAELDWVKLAGEPSAASFRFANPPGKGLHLPEVVYEDENLRASGSMILAGKDDGGGWRRWSSTVCVSGKRTLPPRSPAIRRVSI
ncbi:MAG: DUF3971 domain-containing protein [Sphingomonadales bacterium]